MPEKNILNALELHADTADAIVVCGGDGTLSSVVNVLATARHELLLKMPIIPVPCGLQNSIAASLGVLSAERSVSAFLLGRVEPIPVWEVRVNGALVRYMASYISIGVCAMCVRRLHDLDAVGESYVALLTVRNKYKVRAFYTALRNEVVPCTAALTTTTKSHMEIALSVKLFVASQMPLQHARYSLMPCATFKHGTLGVTYATEAASRLCLWHLLSREAAEGVIINEDGVCECPCVGELDCCIKGVSSEEAEDTLPRVLMMMDGGAVYLLPGSKVSVRRASCETLFASC
ncbi:putative diacylglycerol kinase [Trypanosoma rangeli]|uniref:Putative diacylglycerol kinase n=1 Tax=Trypanosoma rangeli TaxID=5698 RepID=A0A3R7L399_TRYRA|nr:putative diacylglycerol kinase [Trypanosoma rangeli]RNF06718.1 putative diacylglycerol kinase [Trypanosoma rangeli]|eukprot:RNF06718.1 putative diacylglycerol kinase [Trypanosoma rangeli]